MLKRKFRSFGSAASRSLSIFLFVCVASINFYRFRIFYLFADNFRGPFVIHVVRNLITSVIIIATKFEINFETYTPPVRGCLTQTHCTIHLIRNECVHSYSMNNCLEHAINSKDGRMKY